jgi:hypothetical protein
MAMKFSSTPNSAAHQIQQHTKFSSTPNSAAHQIQQRTQFSSAPNYHTKQHNNTSTRAKIEHPQPIYCRQCAAV